MIHLYVVEFIRVYGVPLERSVPRRQGSGQVELEICCRYLQLSSGSISLGDATRRCGKADAGPRNIDGADRKAKGSVRSRSLGWMSQQNGYEVVRTSCENSLLGSHRRRTRITANFRASGVCKRAYCKGLRGSPSG
jgi:hypothetical protein